MKCSPLLAVLTACFCQTLSAASVAPLHQDLPARVDHLEAQTRAMRAELQWLHENPVRLPPVMAGPVSVFRPAAGPAAEAEGAYTWNDLQAEMERLTWTKGGLRIVPYGILWGNMVYATERTAPGSYTLFVLSADDQGEDEFVIDGRTTRVGLDVTGPRLWPFYGSRSGGKVEIDFQGDFSGSRNKGGLLLRQAYWEINNDAYRILLGQTWDVISPLHPGTIMYTIFWFGGNMGYRRGQLRAERYLPLSDMVLVTVQASLNDGIVTDFVSDPEVSGDSAAWPIVQGRLGVTLGPRGGYYEPITVGVSGHVGENILDFENAPPADDVARRTWSFNVDIRVPITDRLGVQGEFFTGENLATYFGGIGQGIDKESRGTIRATGGWIDAWFDWTEYLHSHAGWTIDDPINTDLTTAGMRSYNQAIFGNLICDVSDKFTMGLEVSSWKTLYNTKRPGEAIRVELMGKYGF